MQFRPAMLSRLGEFICGDPPFPFPYRSSSQLNSFFSGLGLDCIHGGETRNRWVREQLIEINNTSGTVGIYQASEEAMIAIVEEIMNPIYYETETDEFTENRDSDFGQAMEQMSKLLKQCSAAIQHDTNTDTVTLVSVDRTTVSAPRNAREVVAELKFSPRVVSVPTDYKVESDSVAVMMPFGGFDGVNDAIKRAATDAGFTATRADDIWDNETILQDIFDLILRSQIVIADFTGRNPNVMYEAGIAHTLGKHTIILTQTLEHVPSNLHGHRVLKYLSNEQGLDVMRTQLSDKLNSLRSQL